ncbi:MAG: hypothetical protein NVSMB4_09070 [Acidimicrobiales bacterium]
MKLPEINTVLAQLHRSIREARRDGNYERVEHLRVQVDLYLDARNCETRVAALLADCDSPDLFCEVGDRLRGATT